MKEKKKHPIRKQSLSQKVKCEIMDFIHSTGLGPHDALPAESELTDILSVSRYTVREALALLEQEKIIYKKQGKGTFLRRLPSTIETGLERLESVTDMIRKSGLEANTRWLGVRVHLPSLDMQRKLQIGEEDEVVTYARLRTANGEFAAYCVDTIPLRLMRYVPENFEGESLMSFLAREMDIVMETAVAYVEACGIPEEIKPLVDVEGLQHLLMLQQTHHDEHERPIVFSYDYFNPELVRFKINRSR